jgi:malate synthase
MSDTPIAEGIVIQAPITDVHAGILTPEALAFVQSLAQRFEPRRRELMTRREAVQAEIDAGKLPDFLPETQSVRDADWTVAPVPADLADRRVEITGPVDRKMVINALNSGAKTYMADFEDSHSPTWTGTIDGQINLRDAVNRTIEFTNPAGKRYRLNDQTATLIVRPRGWHLVEKHVLVNGQPVSGSLFDFGLFFFHNANRLIAGGSGPYFYLPKMESHLEARLWNEVFVAAQEALNIPQGTIKATVLIETILAAFEMDEILYELKDHSAGLNCGRWDYIFSFIKRFKNVPGYLFPDRAQITMTRHCMRSYSLLAIKTCHRRGAHAIGGMAAQIPIKNDADQNREALEKVRADKTREATDGHDGTWVAHPGLVPIAMQEFDKAMPAANQIDRLRNDVDVTAADLLKLPAGSITEAGMRTNISVGIQYMANWLSGLGCVPLYHLMEDAATAEISRSQLWQWVHHPDAAIDDGRSITPELFRSMLTEEMEKIEAEVGETTFGQGKYTQAAKLFEAIITDENLAEFLTIGAYDHLDG